MVDYNDINIVFCGYFDWIECDCFVVQCYDQINLFFDKFFKGGNGWFVVFGQLIRDID